MMQNKCVFSMHCSKEDCWRPRMCCICISLFLIPMLIVEEFSVFISLAQPISQISAQDVMKLGKEY